MDELHLWRYTSVNGDTPTKFGKRRVTSWRMIEATVKEFTHVYKDAVKVEGSL